MTSISRTGSQGALSQPLPLLNGPAQEIKPQDFVPLPPGVKALVDDNLTHALPSAEQEPNLLHFGVEQEMASEGLPEKTYKSALSAYADPGDNTPGLASQEALRQALGVGEDWGGDESIQQLAETLKPRKGHTQNYGHVLRDLAQIKERHGLATANAVAKTLQDYLTHNQPDDGVNAKQLVRNGLGDMAFPSNIDQANKGTCAATAVQMKWALENPETYAKALTRLGEGKTYTTAGGDPLPPNDTWKGDTKDKRNFSARIMQNALMDMGNNVGIDQDYNSEVDENQSFWNDHKGLFSEDTNYILQETTGNDDYDVDSMYSGSSLYGFVEDEIARGRSTVINFKGHAVLVTGIDKKNDQVIINTWGEQYTMPIDDFKKYVQSVLNVDDSGSDNRKTAANQVTQVTH